MLPYAHNNKQNRFVQCTLPVADHWRMYNVMEDTQLRRNLKEPDPQLEIPCTYHHVICLITCWLLEERFWVGFWRWCWNECWRERYAKSQYLYRHAWRFTVVATEVLALCENKSIQAQRYDIVAKLLSVLWDRKLCLSATQGGTAGNGHTAIYTINQES